MNYSVFRFTLNMHNHRSQASVSAFRGDTAIRLLISITDGGNSYFIEDGCTAILSGTKADGTKLCNRCVIENNTTIIYDFTEQTTSCVGVANCEITIYGKDGHIITAPKFVIVVDEREVSGTDILSATEQDALDAVFASEGERVEAERLRDEAEKVRVQFEQDRVDADNARAEAVAKAVEEAEIATEEAINATEEAKSATEKAKSATESISRLERTASRNSKRITNLEQGISPDPFYTDSSVAYVKEVPTNALPYAEVSKVGGMSYVVDGAIKHAKVTSFQATDNLIPYPYNIVPIDGLLVVANSDGSITVNGTVPKAPGITIAGGDASNLVALPAWLTQGKEYTLSMQGATDNMMRLRIYLYKKTSEDVESVNYDTTRASTKTFTIPEGYEYYQIVLLCSPLAKSYECTIQIALNAGSEAKPWTSPIGIESHNIPIEVQSLDGYGEGMDETYHNYIDYERRVFVRCITYKVFDGTEDWSSASDYYYYTLQDSAPNKEGLIASGSSEFEFVRYFSNDASQIRIEPIFESKDALKAHVAELYANGTPLIVIYLLATPIETDISEYIPDTILLDVSQGGVVTFKNEHGFAVPSEITYMLKEITE